LPDLLLLEVSKCHTLKYELCIFLPMSHETLACFMASYYVISCMGDLREMYVRILKLVVCILLHVLGQVQGFRLTQHCFELLFSVLINNRYMFRSYDGQNSVALDGNP
jgi:hypothetical protein